MYGDGGDGVGPVWAFFWVVAIVIVTDVAVCGVCGGGVRCKWWWWPLVVLSSLFPSGTCRL